MAALAVMMRRLSLAPPPAQKAACARLASRASAAFSAGAVTLRAAPPAQRVIAMPIVAKLRPKIDRPVSSLVGHSLIPGHPCLAPGPLCSACVLRIFCVGKSLVPTLRCAFSR